MKNKTVSSQEMLVILLLRSRRGMPEEECRELMNKFFATGKRIPIGDDRDLYNQFELTAEEWKIVLRRRDGRNWPVYLPPEILKEMEDEEAAIEIQEKGETQ